jgi:hypothetical protein
MEPLAGNCVYLAGARTGSRYFMAVHWHSSVKLDLMRLSEGNQLLDKTDLLFPVFRFVLDKDTTKIAEKRFS